ncbi:hypothetical protein IL306_003660 [Fusarium sp. DS 682]|nr:hypothetical protein IL306_003660 [Fusarium sp. DS 682]
MGAYDYPQGVNYINVTAGQIPPGREKCIKDVEKMIGITHKWLGIHAGIQTKMQIDSGNLPDDMDDGSRMKRSDYCIKVLDTIMS